MRAVAELEEAPIDSLVPYARNARTHSESQVAQLAASIREFGFNNPIIVDKAGTILAGHGRIAAARKLGLETVPVLRVPLSGAAARAYILADNRLAMSAGWDDEMLKVEMESLLEDDFDLSITGFSQGEIDALLGGGDELFDEGMELEGDEGEPTKTKDGYAEFAIVLTIENKERLLRRLNEIKNAEGIESMEDALMLMVEGYGQ